MWNNMTKNYYRRYKLIEWVSVVIFITVLLLGGRMLNLSIYFIAAYAVIMNLFFFLMSIKIKKLITQGKIISNTTSKICDFEKNYCVIILAFLLVSTIIFCSLWIMNVSSFKTLRMWIIFDTIIITCIYGYCFDYCIVFFDNIYFVGYKKFSYAEIRKIDIIKNINRNLQEEMVHFELYSENKKIGYDKFFLSDYKYLLKAVEISKS